MMTPKSTTAAPLLQAPAKQAIAPRIWTARSIFALLLAITLTGGVWFGLQDLSFHARIAFITFGLAVIGWVFTNIDDTYVALVAAMVFTITGINSPDEFFEALGDSTIWLLLASFIIAAAATASGLSRRLAVRVVTRARSVKHLFYLLTGVLLVTTFIVPTTSGRAALMLPVFIAISTAIDNRRITRALALLFPTIILLSTVASLIGAGAHLVTVEILWRMADERIGFGRWLMLGLPFALVSCYISTWVILKLFLNRDEQRHALHLRADQLAGETQVTGPFTRREQFVLWVVVALVLLWSTEALHGINNTIVALVGALIVTMPTIGAVSFKEAVKKVEWMMLLFMAATIELGEALVESGGAEWLVGTLFDTLQGQFATSALAIAVVIIGVSLLSHLLITSRTARSSVLVPLVILLAMSLGYNPTTLAFLSTAAAGFCLTLTVSAKPLTMFSRSHEATFTPRDLLKLSGVLLPIHFGLLLVFALYVWPLMGLTISREAPQTRPYAPTWNTKSFEWLPSPSQSFEGSQQNVSNRIPMVSVYAFTQHRAAFEKQRLNWNLIERFRLSSAPWFQPSAGSVAGTPTLASRVVRSSCYQEETVIIPPLGKHSCQP
ncbi:MAG: SLC13 family permease [Chloroflexales bacterium]|nr:SLC13 family permease [Chloroflexales bacterium]